MKRLLAAIGFVWLAQLGSTPQVAAQDLVVTNARILDGTGVVIDKGTIVVRSGKIASVSAGSANVPRARVIDVKGMTVMPGFIDAHRHIIRGNPAQWLEQEAAQRMQEFIDAGFTTVFSAGDSLQEILELRRRLQQGQIKGPRLLVSGRVPLARANPAGRGTGPAVDPARIDISRPPHRPTRAATGIPHDETRAAVRKLKEAGVDAIKTAIIVTPGGPEKDTLSVVADEAKKQGLLSFTHAVTVEDTLAAVAAGTHALAHTPHIGRLEESEDARQKIVRAGIPMVSTLGIFIPAFDKDNKPLFRDRGPFPMMETLSSGGQGPVNARLLWEAGLVYGYGTDTSWAPKDALAQEVRALALVFSPKDIVTILTKNAAAALHRSSELGTLEAGKAADLVILDGDPLANPSNLLNAVMVIKGGEVIAGKR